MVIILSIEDLVRSARNLTIDKINLAHLTIPVDLVYRSDIVVLCHNGYKVLKNRNPELADKMLKAWIR